MTRRDIRFVKPLPMVVTMGDKSLTYELFLDDLEEQLEDMCQRLKDGDDERGLMIGIRQRTEVLNRNDRDIPDIAENLLE